MGTYEHSIDVSVPVRTAYNQWTQFEEFPRFMEGVEEVKQLDDTHLLWVAEIGGQRRDERIAWHSMEGTTNAGAVTFHRIDDGQTRVMLQLEYEPEGAVEKAGDAAGIVKSRVKGDLERFKEFIESRGQETGAWRGEVHQDATR
jgi:uncharacterized membrane protein